MCRTLSVLSHGSRKYCRRSNSNQKTETRFASPLDSRVQAGLVAEGLILFPKALIPTFRSPHAAHLHTPYCAMESDGTAAFDGKAALAEKGSKGA